MNFDLNRLRLLILDVDGVLTDGTKTYDNSGKCISKNFCDRDFTAIKKFEDYGITVVWLSGDSNINEAIANRRNIGFFQSCFYHFSSVKKVSNKWTFLNFFNDVMGMPLTNMGYVGDDYYDLEILEMLKLHHGLPMCVEEAPSEVKEVCGKVLGRGGSGVVAELYDAVRLART